MSVNEFLTALQGSKEDRAALDAIELIVTLRKPEEYEELIHQNAALKAENEALKTELKHRKNDSAELIGLYSRIKQARKLLKENGLPFSFLDR